MNKFIIGFFPLAVILLFILIIPPRTFAANPPFQASLMPNIAVNDRNVMIEGLTLSVWGETRKKHCHWEL
jgi:hypothetical protein